MLEPVSTPLTVTDARLEVSETLLLGRSYRLSGDDREALRYALQALGYKRAAGDHSGEASALNALGLVYHGLGNDAQALAYYLEGLALCETLEDRRSELALLVNLSEVYLSEAYSGEAGLDYDSNANSDPDGLGATGAQRLRALEYTRRCLELSEEIGSLDTAAVSLRSLGTLYTRQGDPDEALVFFGRALELQRRLGDEGGQALTLCKLAESCAAAGKPEAAEHHREGLALARSDHDRPYVLAQVLASSGAHTKDSQRARQYLNEGLELAQQMSLLNLVCRCSRALYKLHEADGEFEGALRHLEALHRASRSLENEHAARRSQHLSVRLELEVQHEAALSELRNTQTDLNERNLRLAERLREQTARLQQGATEDPLTGLYNRRYAERQLKREFVRARRYGRPLSVAVVAIDGFSGVESFPHTVGEAVLKTLAKILTASLRPPDVAARYGAEAFVMILPETDAAGGRTVCERLRRAVNSYRWRELHSELKVTLSAGLCSELDPVSAERMLSDAATKLQRARESGKNRVV